MKFSRIALVILYTLCLISCQNDTSNKNEVKPKKKPVPSKEYHKTEKSSPKLDVVKPVKKPYDTKVKKKKLKAIDTLKPITVIP